MKIICLIIISIFPLSIFSQTNDDNIFLELMKTEFQAYKDKNPSQWLKYVDENAIFTGMDNLFKTKDQIVEEMRNAPDIFLSASETYENIISKVYGNTGILSCLSTFVYTSSSGSLDRIKFKFIRVHIKEGDMWKLVYHSAIPITENI